MEPMALALIVGMALCVIAIVWVGFFPPDSLK